MKGLALDALSVPLRTVRLLAVDFGDLPAPDIGVSPIFPDRLRLNFHRTPVDFEAWREALGVVPDDVVYEEHAGFAALSVSVGYGGGTVELVGYVDAPAAVRDKAPA